MDGFDSDSGSGLGVKRPHRETNDVSSDELSEESGEAGNEIQLMMHQIQESLKRKAASKEKQAKKLAERGVKVVRDEIALIRSGQDEKRKKRARQLEEKLDCVDKSAVTQVDEFLKSRNELLAQRISLTDSTEAAIDAVQHLGTQWNELMASQLEDLKLLSSEFKTIQQALGKTVGKQKDDERLAKMVMQYFSNCPDI